jgi:cytochrome c oxidase subunit 2
VRKHPLAQMLTIGVVASIIGVAISLNIDWFPRPADTASHKIDTLYDVLLICSVPVFVLVMTVAIYSVVKFRARPGDMRDGAPIHGNTRLEVVWVTVPFLMVTALAIYGWITLNDVEAKQKNEQTIDVQGQQFTWHFKYAKAGGTADPGSCTSSTSTPGPNQFITTQLYLKKDQPVYFRICSRDVIHSFWVPEFRLKSDAVPGMLTHIRVTPNKLGNYTVVCAELCGLGHSTMRVAVHVLNPDQYDAWFRQQTKGAAPAPAKPGAPANTAAGKQVFTSSGCASCHTLSDANASGTIGPNLNTLSADAAKFGKQLKETPEQYVKQSIVDPGKFVRPGFPKGVMPTTFGQQLSAQQIDSLVKYLLSVSGK